MRYGPGPDRPAGVCIPTFENESQYAGLELLVSEALRREFLSRGSAPLESDCDRADLVISGRLHPPVRVSRSFSTTVLALEYEVTAQLDVRLRYRDGGELRLDPSSLWYKEIYLSSADVEVERKNYQEAMRRVAQVLASRVCDAMDLDRVVRGKGGP